MVWEVTLPSAAELRQAYAGKRVFLTGHTGFKGSWLALWLRELGAEVVGFSLAPDTTPSLFEIAGVEGSCDHHIGDVCDLSSLRSAVRNARPDYVFHLAAQALVRDSYERPLETVQTNVLGTAHLLEAIRLERLRCAVVIVTSDKCYENRERVHGYREDDAMGGHDVYSMSKGAAELVAASWRRSFFPASRLSEHGVAIATARAGNVIGGGDWARDRLIPDAIRALAGRRPVPIRNPTAVRPWQHVLEPLGGYLLLGARLAGVGTNSPAAFCEAWNLGPRFEDSRAVHELIEAAITAWGSGSWEDRSDPTAPHEAAILRLSIDKAQALLSWGPRWRFGETIRRTMEWYRAFQEGTRHERMRDLCRQQIKEYEEHGS